MESPKFMRVFTWKALPATERRGKRIKITCPRLQQSVTISSDYDCDSCQQCAVKYLAGNEWEIIGVNEDAQVIILGKSAAKYPMRDLTLKGGTQ